MIPDRDVPILQRQAFELYRFGGGQDDVKRMIREVTDNEKEIEELASKFARNWGFYQQEQNRVAKKNAPLDKLVGGILLFGGILVTLGSYIFFDEVYFIFWGAMLSGGIIFIRAIVTENKKSS